MELEPADRLAWQRLGLYRDLREFRNLKSLLAPELAKCFAPDVHEGQRRPYGALIARDDNIGESGTLLSIADPAALRGAADGLNTLVYCVKSVPLRLLRLHKPLSSQDSCSTLAEDVDGVLVRVDASGMIWVASSDAVTTIDDKNGWTRPATQEVISMLTRLAPSVDESTLGSTVRLAYSLLSPHRVGATLLYSLTDTDSTNHQTRGASIVELDLNVNRAADFALIEHELRHTDGATIVGRMGDLLWKNVILNASSSALATVQTEGGTRHNSACRHTYDRPDLLALVISADGPVTVFSDGRRALSLVLQDRELPWNPSGGEMWIEQLNCPKCRCELMVRKIVLYGWRDNEEGYCPICRKEVASVHGWGVEVGLMKTPTTVEQIGQFRSRSQ